MSSVLHFFFKLSSTKQPIKIVSGQVGRDWSWKKKYYGRYLLWFVMEKALQNTRTATVTCMFYVAVLNYIPPLFSGLNWPGEPVSFGQLVSGHSSQVAPAPLSKRWPPLTTGVISFQGTCGCVCNTQRTWSCSAQTGGRGVKPRAETWWWSIMTQRGRLWLSAKQPEDKYASAHWRRKCGIKAGAPK